LAPVRGLCRRFLTLAGAVGTPCAGFCLGKVIGALAVTKLRVAQSWMTG